jgi:hypothetical protein
LSSGDSEGSSEEEEDEEEWFRNAKSIIV